MVAYFRGNFAMALEMVTLLSVMLQWTDTETVAVLSTEKVYLQF